MELWRCIKCSSALFATAIAVLFCIFFSSPAAAQPAKQSQIALGVSPAIAELVLEPGQPKKFVITVTNIIDVALPVKVTAASLQLQEEVADEHRALFDASKWIQVAEPEFILYPRQQKTISITATSPVNTEPGGHYATIFFQPLVPAEAVKNNTALIGSKVGALTLFVVRGAIEEAADVNLDAPLFSQHGPVELSLHIKNPGNVHFMPTGSVKIRNREGVVVATVPLPPTLVLPKTTKTIPIKWDNKKQIGYFSAQASVRYGARQTSLSDGSVGFWILPWLRFVTLLLLAGLLAFVFWRTGGRRRRALSALFGRTRPSESKPRNE
jgi:hypothetical protein